MCGRFQLTKPLSLITDGNFSGIIGIIFYSSIFTFTVEIVDGHLRERDFWWSDNIFVSELLTYFFGSFCIGTKIGCWIKLWNIIKWICMYISQYDISLKWCSSLFYSAIIIFGNYVLQMALDVFIFIGVLHLIDYLWVKVDKSWEITFTWMGDIWELYENGNLNTSALKTVVEKIYPHQVYAVNRKIYDRVLKIVSRSVLDTMIDFSVFYLIPTLTYAYMSVTREEIDAESEIVLMYIFFTLFTKTPLYVLVSQIYHYWVHGIPYGSYEWSNRRDDGPMSVTMVDYIIIYSYLFGFFTRYPGCFLTLVFSDIMPRIGCRSDCFYGWIEGHFYYRNYNCGTHRSIEIMLMMGCHLTLLLTSVFSPFISLDMKIKTFEFYCEALSLLKSAFLENGQLIQYIVVNILFCYICLLWFGYFFQSGVLKSLPLGKYLLYFRRERFW